MLQILKDMDEEDKVENKVLKEFAKQIAWVEYYYGVRIDKNYPILKRFNQYEQLKCKEGLFYTDAKRFGLTK